MTEEIDVEATLKDMGIDRSHFRKITHKIVLKKRPPTLPQYPSLQMKIVLTEPEADDSKVYHMSRGSLSDFEDRRPRRDNAEKDAAVEWIAKKKIRDEERKQQVKWNGFVFELDDEEEEVDKKKTKKRRKGNRDRSELKKEYADTTLIDVGARIIQKHHRRMKARAAFKLIRKKKAKRKHIANEILQTERDYVNHLRVANDVYAKPLRALAKDAGKKFFSVQDFNNIFTATYTNMTQVNEMFLKDLTTKILNGNDFVPFGRISKAFKVITPYFKMYRSYCSNFDNAVASLKKLKSDNAQFGEICKVMDKDDRTTKLGLNSYLILPIQRIPRYRMLLHDLMKNTWEEHPDYEDLGKALAEIFKVAKFLDKAITEIEESQKLIQIQKQFTETKNFNIPAPHRRLIKVLELQKVVLGGGTVLSPASLHIFNDIVVFSSKIRNELFQYCTHIPLLNCNLYTSGDEGNELFVKITTAGEEIMVTTKDKKAKEDFLNEVGKLKALILKQRTSAGMQGPLQIEFERTCVGVAKKVTIPWTKEECVELVKHNKFTIHVVNSKGKCDARSFRVSNDESMLKWEEEDKKKKVQKHLKLSGDVISELVQGQKAFQQIKKLSKNYNGFQGLGGLCFSLRYSEGGGRRKTLDLVCSCKRDLLIWTQALLFILVDQRKTVRVRNERTRNRPDGGQYFKIKMGKKQMCGNDLYVWGGNQAHALGHGGVYKGKDVHSPIPVRHLLYLDVQDVFVGKSCFFAILKDGKLFSWGEGSSGKLGHRSNANVPLPTQIAKFDGKKLLKIASGKEHTLFLEDSGLVYACGNNANGQCGIATKKKKPIIDPTIIPGLKDVIDIACGSTHSMAVTRSGEIFCFGNNESGQLGTGQIGDKDAINLVSKAKNIDNVQFTKCAAGAWHSMAVTKDGNMYTWGDGSSGQLGDGKAGKGVKMPIPTVSKIPFLKNRVADISSGSSHCGAVTKRGKIYMWGSGIYGQIGNGKKPQVVHTPTVLKQFQQHFCLSLVCGANHTLALIEKGEKKSVISWGGGTYGRLGTGKESDEPKPTIIQNFEKKSIVSVHAGGNCSGCVINHGSITKKDVKKGNKDLCCMNCGNDAKFKKNTICGFCDGFYCQQCFTKGDILNVVSFKMNKACETCHKIFAKTD